MFIVFFLAFACIAYLLGSFTGLAILLALWAAGFLGWELRDFATAFEQGREERRHERR
jgi:protein-S-isoprenylcysteine O-methyltransferase Ste14